MMRRLFLAGTPLAALAIVASSTFAQSPSKGPKAKVSLVPFVEGVVPERPFDVGVRFELEPEWHIYWSNSGDAGLPPKFTWRLPPGFSAGEPRFPVPRRLYSPGDIVTNVLGGEPVLMVTITPAAGIEAQQVTLGADVAYLVCAEQCIREEAKISAELPVRPAGSEVVPANEPLLKSAQRNLPLSSSKHLEIDAVVSPGVLRPGSDFELTLNVNIKPGLHIQSHKPTIASLIPAEVFIEKIEGVSLRPAEYPEPKKRKDPYLGTLTEYGGKFAIRVAATVDKDSKTLPSAVSGVFAYQACNDQGNCFRPEGLAFSAKVGGTAQNDAAAPAATADKNTGTTVPSIVSDPAAVPSGGQGFDAFFRRFGLVGLLAACFVYGLFINATPCVLPLLSIKVLGFVQQAHESRRKTAALGLSFGLGVVLFFVVLGLLASNGKNILMYPAAVVALGGVILALALSMLGVYTLQVPRGATNLEARIHSEGLFASFGKGALAPVLGFACTGPLLAGAWGWAVKQPPNVAILAFVFAGLGMASPYMLLGANPRWLSFLPRPGNWMITFERVMGFLLLAMVVWMIHPLSQQLGVAGLEWTLVFYIVIAFGCWLLGKVKVTMSDLQRWQYRGVAASIIAVTGAFIYGWVLRPAAAEIKWQPWSLAAVESIVKAGRPAFVDFTAAYCTVCKVNKIRAINTEEVRTKLDQCGAVPFQGDYTSGDPAISEILAKYDRAGVPLNLIYPPGRPDSPIVLTPDLSREYLLEKLDEVACAKPVAASILGATP